METMRAAVFCGKDELRVEEIEKPRALVGEAIIRVTLTTICGTDLHIVRGEYPVRPGLVIGHEPVGVIEEIGAGVTGYSAMGLSESTRYYFRVDAYSSTAGNSAFSNTASAMTLSAASVAIERARVRAATEAVAIVAMPRPAIMIVGYM